MEASENERIKNGRIQIQDKWYDFRDVRVEIFQEMRTIPPEDDSAFRVWEPVLGGLYWEIEGASDGMTTPDFLNLPESFDLIIEFDGYQFIAPVAQRVSSQRAPSSDERRYTFCGSSVWRRQTFAVA